MYTATTNLVAAVFQNESNTNDKSLTRTTIITALQIGIIVGFLFGIGLCTSSTYLLKALLGGSESEMNLEVLLAADRYVKIRALGMPAAVLIGTAQSACLGMKDIRSPLLVMVGASVVNLIGDILFVGNDHPWLGGAAGAAWATVFSQYAALVMFLKWLKMKNKATDNGNGSATKNTDDMNSLSLSSLYQKIRQRKNKDSNVHTNNEEEKAYSTRGILHGYFKYRDLLKLPSSKVTAKKFSPYLVPVTTTAIGRVSGYVAMSHVVSSALGTIEMAAQQIVLAFFLCFIPMCDSLNLTAQSFVPGIFEYKGDAKLRSRVMKKTTNNFLKAGGIFGLVLMGVVSCIPLVSRFFSLDPNVIASVNSTTPYLACYALLSGIVCSGEGL
jgi:Na+-driven multidrug efflux pump